MATTAPASTAHRNGTEKLNAVLYANEDEVPVMGLYGGLYARYSLNPYNYPNDVGAANTAFNTYGLYTNTLQTVVTDGTLQIGIYNYDSVDSDWCIFDNFKLMYLGPSTGIVTPSNSIAGED